MSDANNSKQIAALQNELTKTNAALQKLLIQHSTHAEKTRGGLKKIGEKVDYATSKIRGAGHGGAVISAHMVWNHQDFFVNAKSRVNVPGIPDIRCYFLQSCLRSLENLPGDVVECGVREGKSSLFMLHAMNRQREFYLFDSFEGLSDPHKDFDTLQSSLNPEDGTRIFATDSAAVERRFAGYDNVKVLQGWIPDRFHEVGDINVCLIHVDVDLYQPTLDTLEFFYPRLVNGGIVICDDYGSGAYPGARQAMDEFFAEKEEKPIELPQGQAFVYKR